RIPGSRALAADMADAGDYRLLSPPGDSASVAHVAVPPRNHVGRPRNAARLSKEAAVLQAQRDDGRHRGVVRALCESADRGGRLGPAVVHQATALRLAGSEAR